MIKRLNHRLLALSAAALATLGSQGLRAADTPERVYVSDEKGGNVVIVDPKSATVLARIPVGKRPRGIQVSPDHTRLYVALSGSPMGGPNVDESKLPPPDRRYDGIGVVDLKTQTLTTTYESGADPETFALTHDGKTLYVSNEDTGMLSAVDLAQGQVRTTVAVGSEPEGVAVSADDRLVYVACETSNSVYVLETPDLKVLAKIPTEKRPRAILLPPGSHRGYVTNEFGGSITVFSTDDYKVLNTISLGTRRRCGRWALLPATARRCTSPPAATARCWRSTRSPGILRTMAKIGQRPWGLALSARRYPGLHRQWAGGGHLGD